MRAREIFICYRRQDTRSTAGRLYDVIEEHFPGSVFMDVEDIPPGERYVDLIRASLRDGKVVVAVIGPDWLRVFNGPTASNRPDYVYVELEEAIRAGKIIVPVLVDGAQMPTAGLPPGLREVEMHNAIDIRTHRFHADIAPLLRSLYHILVVRPPTLYERFVSSFPGTKVMDEPARTYNAMISLWAGAVAALALLSARTHQWVPVLALISATTGGIGINSRRVRWRAITGLLLATAAVAVVVVLMWRGGSP